jgi:hypothetical protein
MPNYLPMMSQDDYSRALRRVRHDELGRTMLNLFATTPAQFAEKIVRAEGYAHQIEQLKRMQDELDRLTELQAKIDRGEATLAPGSQPLVGAMSAYLEAIKRMDAALDEYQRRYGAALAAAAIARHEKCLSR